MVVIKKILIKRQAANGDVLIAAAVVPAIKKMYPGHEIYFETFCPSALIGNPSIDYIVREKPNLDFDVVFDLDLAYEKRPNENILLCYAEAAGVPIGWCVPCVARSPVNKPLLNRYVVVHAGRTSWAGRNWDDQKWNEIAMRLHNSDYQIVCVGRNEDRFVPCDVDCRDRTTIHELATIIEDAELFVGIDSLPFHVAQSVGAPCVCFFGSIKPELRIISPRVRPVVAKGLACLGCHHKQKAPAVSLPQCPLGTLDCETLVSVDDMWQEISAELKINPA